MGDMYAVMGDSEVCVSGCEVSARITVGIDLIKEKATRWPIVVREEGLYIVVSLPTIDAAPLGDTAGDPLLGGSTWDHICRSGDACQPGGRYTHQPTR